MKTGIFALFLACSCYLTTAFATDVKSAEPAQADVLTVMERVADWQLAHPSKHHPADWTQAAGYTGFMALAEVSASPRFHDAMMAMSEANKWAPHKRVYHADDHCVSQTYIELFFRHKDPRMLAPTIERFDYILAHPLDDNLVFDKATNPDFLNRWSWCDSLFMAPPAWARLAVATGKQAYLDYAIRQWWVTSAYLYDESEHLYFRDSTYFKKREVNDRKIFWSRGNGWVMAGLVRMLQYLPAEHPARARFVQQFREMATSVLRCQQADGLWRASLLDPEHFPLKEASGSGFYTYALAWGVNQGLLDSAVATPAVQRAWAALVGCVAADGQLTHVQPIGADPKKFDENATEVYGVGAFLLAGSEVYKLVGARSAQAH